MDGWLKECVRVVALQGPRGRTLEQVWDAVRNNIPAFDEHVQRVLFSFLRTHPDVRVCNTEANAALFASANEAKDGEGGKHEGAGPIALLQSAEWKWLDDVPEDCSDPALLECSLVSSPSAFVLELGLTWQEATGLNTPQLRILWQLALAGADGVLQFQLSERLGLDSKALHYQMKGVERVVKIVKTAVQVPTESGKGRSRSNRLHLDKYSSKEVDEAAALTPESPRVVQAIEYLRQFPEGMLESDLRAHLGLTPGKAKLQEFGRVRSVLAGIKGVTCTSVVVKGKKTMAAAIKYTPPLSERRQLLHDREMVAELPVREQMLCAVARCPEGILRPDLLAKFNCVLPFKTAHTLTAGLEDFGAESCTDLRKKSSTLRISLSNTARKNFEAQGFDFSTFPPHLHGTFLEPPPCFGRAPTPPPSPPPPPAEHLVLPEPGAEADVAHVQIPLNPARPHPAPREEEPVQEGQAFARSLWGDEGSKIPFHMITLAKGLAENVEKHGLIPTSHINTLVTTMRFKQGDETKADKRTVRRLLDLLVASGKYHITDAAVDNRTVQVLTTVNFDTNAPAVQAKLPDLVKRALFRQNNPFSDILNVEELPSVESRSEHSRKAKSLKALLMTYGFVTAKFVRAKRLHLFVAHQLDLPSAAAKARANPNGCIAKYGVPFSQDGLVDMLPVEQFLELFGLSNPIDELEDILDAQLLVGAVPQSVRTALFHPAVLRRVRRAFDTLRLLGLVKFWRVAGVDCAVLASELGTTLPQGVESNQSVPCLQTSAAARVFVSADGMAEYWAMLEQLSLEAPASHQAPASPDAVHAVANNHGPPHVLRAEVANLPKDVFVRAHWVPDLVFTKTQRRTAATELPPSPPHFAKELQEFAQTVGCTEEHIVLYYRLLGRPYMEVRPGSGGKATKRPRRVRRPRNEVALAPLPVADQLLLKKRKAPSRRLGPRKRVDKDFVIGADSDDDRDEGDEDEDNGDDAGHPHAVGIGAQGQGQPHEMRRERYNWTRSQDMVLLHAYARLRADEEFASILAAIRAKDKARAQEQKELLRQREKSAKKVAAGSDVQPDDDASARGDAQAPAPLVVEQVAPEAPAFHRRRRFAELLANEPLLSGCLLSQCWRRVRLMVHQGTSASVVRPVFESRLQAHLASHGLPPDVRRTPGPNVPIRQVGPVVQCALDRVKAIVSVAEDDYNAKLCFNLLQPFSDSQVREAFQELRLGGVTTAIKSVDASRKLRLSRRFQDLVLRPSALYLPNSLIRHRLAAQHLLDQADSQELCVPEFPTGGMVAQALHGCFHDSLELCIEIPPPNEGDPVGDEAGSGLKKLLVQLGTYEEHSDVADGDRKRGPSYKLADLPMRLKKRKQPDIPNAWSILVGADADLLAECPPSPGVASPPRDEPEPPPESLLPAAAPAHEGVALGGGALASWLDSDPQAREAKRPRRHAPHVPPPLAGRSAVVQSAQREEAHAGSGRSALPAVIDEGGEGGEGGEGAEGAEESKNEALSLPNVDWDAEEEANFSTALDNTEAALHSTCRAIFDAVVASGGDGTPMAALVDNLGAQHERASVEASLQSLVNFGAVFRADAPEREHLVATRFKLLWFAPCARAAQHKRGTCPPAEPALADPNTERIGLLQERVGRPNEKAMGLEYSDGDVCPMQPWRKVTGEIDHNVLIQLRRCIVSHVLHRPGITESQLLQRVRVLTAQQVRRLLDVLEADGAIASTYVPVSVQPASLFSSPVGGHGKTRRERCLVPTTLSMEVEAVVMGSPEPTPFGAEWAHQDVRVSARSTAMEL